MQNKCQTIPNKRYKEIVQLRFEIDVATVEYV